MKTPVVIFGFNRPDAFARMVASLKNNVGFEEYPIYVYIDGPRGEHDIDRIAEVETQARLLTENVHVSDTNKGLGNSIIKGVSEVISKYGKAIVLEDDLVLMPGFLQYMEDGLSLYSEDKRVFSVCGYGLKVKQPKGYVGDVYLCNRSSSWGWATWADRWKSVDWTVSDFNELQRSRSLRREFNKGGSDMYGMLRGYMEGKNKSWAIRFCYSQFRQKKYSVHPFKSLVANEGFGVDATNCRQKYSRFKIELNEGTEQLMIPSELKPNEELIKALAHYHGLPLRLYSKIRSILNI